MAEDAKEVTEVKDGTAEGKETTETSEKGSAPVELSPTEQLAKSQGWVPLDEWDGDPKDHRGAKEFVDRGELLGKIRSQSQELQSVKAIVTTLSEHNKRVYQAGYENAIKELKVARASAIENADGKALALIEDQLDDAKEKLAAAKAAPVQAAKPAGPTPDFQLFLQRNPQYLSEATFRHWSHGMALEFAKVNPSATEGDVYAFIEREAKKEWPTKYGNQRKAPPSPNGEGKGTGAGKDASVKGNASFDALIASLPDDQAKVAKDMVKRGLITKEKYFQDYEAIGGNR